jgi:hypothetical protein
MIGTPLKEVKGRVEITDQNIVYVSLREYNETCEKQGIEPDDLLTFTEVNDLVTFIGCKVDGREGYLFIY